MGECLAELDGVRCDGKHTPDSRVHSVAMDPRNKSPWFQGIKVYWISPLSGDEGDGSCIIPINQPKERR